MLSDKLIFIVTGAVGSGKSRLLFRLREATRRQYRTAGFISSGKGRTPGSKEPADRYQLEVVGSGKSMPWAVRRTDGRGFDFDQETRVRAEAMVRSQLNKISAEICLLDEIGRLELNGMGFADLVRFVLASPCQIVVVAVKKNVWEEVIDAFAIAAPVVIDLDITDADAAFREIRSRIAARDDKRVGAFAGVGGLVEVGIGSTLHAFKAPFKGHILAYLQTLLLIAFGKQLNGRGLVRISLITAMLKAFSPVGNPIRPMAFIFIQGSVFSLPIRLLGWNLPSILLGSIDMAWFTFAAALTVDYLTFGQSIFEAFSRVISLISGWLGVKSVSLVQVLAGIFVIKGLLALGIGCLAYFGDMGPVIRRLGRARSGQSIMLDARIGVARAGGSFVHSARAAFRDILRPKFILVYFISILFILFFARLSRDDLLLVTVRGLCISYLCFLALRRIDIALVAGWLDRKAGLGLSRSLSAALGVLGGTQRDTSKKGPDVTGDTEASKPT